MDVLAGYCDQDVLTALKSSSDEKTASLDIPTRPDGTEVKKGRPEMREEDEEVVEGREGLRNISTSAARENWGMRVSSLVDTRMVRERSGSTWGNSSGTHKRTICNVWAMNKELRATSKEATVDRNAEYG